ncbi:unnamed protein product [Rhizophagus irregularis]|nr:unnamed protein product [Rhizophagus irregularis]
MLKKFSKVRIFSNIQRQDIYPLLGIVSEEQNYFNGTLLNKVADEKRSEGEMEDTNIMEDAEDTEDIERVEEVERMKSIEITGQYVLNNHRWIKVVDKNFDGVQKLVNDITKFNDKLPIHELGKIIQNQQYILNNQK